VDFTRSSRAAIAWLSISSPGLGGSAAPATSTSRVRRAKPSTDGESESILCVASLNDELEVRVLLGLLVVATRHRESRDLLAELVVADDEPRRGGIPLGLVLGGALGRTSDRDEAKQDPRRASPEGVQDPLKALVCGLSIHSVALLSHPWA
jgi:hypothetical protein